MRRTVSGLLIGFLLIGPPGAAAAEDAAALARDAARACEASDAALAATRLKALVEVLQRDLGESHPATSLARMNAERLGVREFTPPGAPPASSVASPELETALRGLRACAALRSGADADQPGPKENAPEASYESASSEALRAYSEGRYRDAATHAERARVLARNGPEIVRANQAIADARLALGDSAAALQAAQDADGAARLTGSIGVRIQLARLLARTGDLGGAARRLGELEQAATSAADRAEWEEASGELRMLLGSPAAAARTLESAQSKHVATFGRDSAQSAAVTHLLGDAHRMAGDLPAALDAYQEALAMRGRLGDTGDPETAASLNALGVVYAELRDWPSADEAFGSALAMLTRARGESHPDVLRVRLNRARVRWGSSPSAESAAGYAGATDALRQVLGRDDLNVAIALRNLANVEATLGRYARAEQLLDDALSTQRARLGDAHPETALTHLERGRLRVRTGRVAEASAEFREATASLEKALGAEHPLVARYRTHSSRLASAQGDGASAWADAVTAARILTLYLERSLGALTDRQRSLLAETSEDAVGALLSIPSGSPRETYLAMLPHRDSIVRTGAAVQARLRALGSDAQARLAELEAKRALYVAAIVGQSPQLATGTADLAREIDASEAALAAHSRDLGAQQPERVLASACEHLAADQAIIEFVSFDRTLPGAPGDTKPSVAAIVIRQPDCRVRIVQLGESAPVESAQQRFEDAMRSQRADDAAARTELGERLLTPLATELAGTDRWFVASGGALWGVPFGALPDPERPDHYLVERVTVAYLTSLYEIGGTLESPAGASFARPLLFGAPDFGRSTAKGPVIVSAAGPCTLPPFDPLPGADAEIEGIRTLLGNRTPVLGTDATKQRFLAELGTRPDVIHLATHGYFAALSGCSHTTTGDRSGAEDAIALQLDPLLFSGLVMAGANGGGTVQAGAAGGILTAFEIARLDLRSARLVVLSACDTGIGSRQRGQEVQGLRWAFRVAGANALLTSIWRSNDASTRKLMTDFYGTLTGSEATSSGSTGARCSSQRGANGFRAAEALRCAQLALVRDEQRLKLRRPLVWANFVVSGLL